MPTIEVTDDQLDRIEAVRTDVSEALAGPYGHVRTTDALEYLLDTYTPPGDAATDDAPTAAATGAEDARDESGDSEPGAGESGAGESGDSESGAGESGDSESGADERTPTDSDTDRLNAMMDLLNEHADKWSTGSGDEPYEVELPDGSTKSARTKDNVRGVLFKHYR